MDLSNLQKLKGKNKQKRRRGRGIGSTLGGHTTGSGMKGQKSRSGSSLPFGFEGGQIPIFRKLPKIGGFNNKNSKKIGIVKLEQLNKFEDKATVTPKSFVENGHFKVLPKHGVKILGNDKITKKLILEGFLYSESARKTLEKAGCEIK